MNDGSMLVIDDAGGIVWRVAPGQGSVKENATIAGFKGPESALQVPDGRIFVSEIGERNKAGDGDGGIALVTPQGERVPYVLGLDDPKGLAWWAGSLYVADVHNVYRIDRFGHAVLIAGAKDFPAKPQFLNDLAAAPDGTLYVSDTGDLGKGGGAVFSIDQSGVVKRLPTRNENAQLQNPNGLLPVERNKLLVADFVSGQLYRVDLASLEATPVANGLGAADGIAKAADGQLYVSNWKTGEISQVGRNGNVKELETAERFGAAEESSRARPSTRRLSAGGIGRRAGRSARRNALGRACHAPRIPCPDQRSRRRRDARRESAGAVGGVRAERRGRGRCRYRCEVAHQWRGARAED